MAVHFSAQANKCAANSRPRAEPVCVGQARKKKRLRKNVYRVDCKQYYAKGRLLNEAATATTTDVWAEADPGGVA